MGSNTQFEWPFQLRQLAVMLEAGIAADVAVASLGATSGKEMQTKLKNATRAIKRGVALPEAFYKSKLVNEFDYSMLNTAADAGRIFEGLNHISERRVNQLQRVDSFKASLVLPKALVFIGLFAGVFIRSATGSQSVTEALISGGWTAAWFYFFCYLVLHVFRADTRIWMSWFWPHTLMRKRSEWLSLSLEYLLYNNLVWQVSSGVTYSQAVERWGSLLTAQDFRQKVERAAKQMEQGKRLSEALIDEGLVISNRMRQILLIADESGNHELAIKNELKLQNIQLAQINDDFFKWVPRVFYILALVWVSKLMTF